MALNLEELDQITRKAMLQEFESEQASGNPYQSNKLSSAGMLAFPKLMRDAIMYGNEESLAAALANAAFWNPYQQTRNGQIRRNNLIHDAEVLGLGEFNTWYVRGFAKRLMNEGAAVCQVYRAGMPKEFARFECTCLEGQTVDVSVVYAGHRIRYWPTQGNMGFSIPSGVNCHHSIRRVK